MLRKKGIIVREHFDNPLHKGGRSVYFKDTRNKQEYSYLLGCVGSPALKRRGFGMILAVDRNPTPKLQNSGTDNRHIRVLDEWEELDFKPLILTSAKKREKWIGKKAHEDILNQVWWSGPINDSHTRTLVKINENFKSSQKPTLYLSSSQTDFKEVVDCLYDNMLALVLTNKVRGYLSNFRLEDSKKTDAETLNPPISALGRAVHYLTAFAPWGHPWWQQSYHDHSPWDEASFLPDESDMWSQPTDTGGRIATMEEEPDLEYDDSRDRYARFEEEEYSSEEEDDGGEVDTIFD